MKGRTALSFCIAMTVTPSAAAAERDRCAELAPERAIACHVNAEREQHDRAPLRPSSVLAQAAQGHAKDMVARSYFAHVAPDGDGVGDRARAAGYLRDRPRWWVGECLAWGTGSRGTPAGIVRMWMASPPHRRLVLSRRAREVGIGLAEGAPQSVQGTGAVTVALALGAR
ncbi:CAP domain-containing protein [Solirubrobacter phytolaccae]|uniref:CAP domain-containing protein n=1 Tax=Solirubrobacter phytolaccae TaxID=1404360 RepID=A0A9X3NAA1_9ACTN|nr:CAP domain-containing protein [Solirubrobacter phytolaccae]MDA0181087.1 CAP domain-containing protein [Solirubrobacter phytolaccae]